MKTTNRTLARATLSAIKAGKSVDQTMRSLAAYLISERRSKDADAIMRDISGLLLTDYQQLELSVTTVNGLADSLRQHIEDLFKTQAKHIIINQEHDPTVIGGVLVETGDQRLDLTVRRQLQRLKEMGV